MHCASTCSIVGLDSHSPLRHPSLMLLIYSQNICIIYRTVLEWSNWDQRKSRVVKRSNFFWFKKKKKQTKNKRCLHGFVYFLECSIMSSAKVFLLVCLNWFLSWVCVCVYVYVSLLSFVKTFFRPLWLYIIMILYVIVMQSCGQEKSSPRRQ